jgi:hypothetical protein
MVHSTSGKAGYRSFTVVDAARSDGCKTKFAIKGSGGRYISKEPEGAARKAFSRLCHRKRIRGQCAMIITVQELTQGSNGKTWTYRLNREKLATPIELNGRIIEYRPVAKAVNSMPTTCGSGKGKSSGPMKSLKAKSHSGHSHSKRSKTTKRTTTKH